MDTTEDLFAALHAGLSARSTPETVASTLKRLGVDQLLKGAPSQDLVQLARWSHHSSMPEAWRHHRGLADPYAAAQRALDAVTDAVGRSALRAADPTDASSLLVWVEAANDLLGLTGGRPARRRPRRDAVVTSFYGSYSLPARSRGRRGDTHGHADPRTGLDAADRRDLLPGVSVRAYRRAVRTVNHLEARTHVLAAERDREEATAFAKSRLAHTITLTDLSADLPTAAFVSYYTARLGLRTVFTNDAQARPMDTLAEALLKLALESPTARVDVIARVLTRQSVLERLSATQRGELLGVYYNAMSAHARVLERVFDPKRDRTRMVVRRGDDSSSWNAASRAFNQARTGWLNLLSSMGLSDLLEQSCPGKVPALVAADVAQWHDEVHADTGVFAELPLPWEVVLDQVPAPASEVRDVCARHGLDADATGWTQPYRQPDLAEVAATPELVHGVEVSSSALAALLRANGTFSGQA